MPKISDTDLILNQNGSVYHLNLLPGEVAETIITVGDPERVGEVSKYFDHIDVKRSKREFVTHTGTIGLKRLTVISTGIGTDNIDIVLNELDALFNIDLHTREPHEQLKSLNIVRIGTSGAIRADIPVDSLLVSETAFGLDALMQYYQQQLSTDETKLLEDFKAILPPAYTLSPYIASADKTLLQLLAKDTRQGITISAPGFYAPQGRQLRAKNAIPQLWEKILNFSSGGKHIANLEMETAGIYGLASVLGHKAISFNVILANRATQKFSGDPKLTIDKHIKQILERISDTL